MTGIKGADSTQEHPITLELGIKELNILAGEDSYLLDKMGEAGLPVRKSCLNGVCGLCKCRLKKGEITYLLRKPHGLWEKHIDEGLILPCIAYARSELVIDRISLLDK